MSTLRTNEVEMLDGLGKGAITFDSVQEMQDSTVLKVGQKVRTLGYYEPGDGGGNDYEIVAAGTGTDDGGSFIDLSGSGFQAESAIGGTASVAQYGAIPGLFDGDHTAQIQAVLDNPKITTARVPFPATADSAGRVKWYNISNITIPAGKILIGDDLYATKKTLGDCNFEYETGKRVAIKVTGSIGTPAITLLRHSASLGFTMLEVRQKREVTSSTEPWNDTQIAIRLGGDPAALGNDANNSGQSIGSITFLGFKKFIDQWSGDGTQDPRPIGNLSLTSLFGTPYECAVEILHSADTCWARDCQWIPHTVRTGWATGDQTILRYNLAKSTTGWRLGKADGFQFFGCQGLGMRYWFHSIRDAYPSDNNRGGGFNFINCPVDAIGVGYKFDRDGGNDIGASITGGQIIPIVYLGDEENTAFQFNGTTDIKPGFILSVQSVSIHTGGTTPQSLTPGEGNFYGPSSTKAPRYIAEFVNGATGIHLNINSCRLQSYYTEAIDWSAIGAGNVANFSDCQNKNKDPYNKKTVAPSTADAASQEYILHKSGNNILRFRTEGNSDIAEVFVAPGGQMRLDASGNVKLRAGVNASGPFSATLRDQNGAWIPDTDAAQPLGGAGARWSQVYSVDGSINTSDEREKQSVRELTDTERSVAVELKGMIRAFKWTHSVEEKGEDKTRIHFGVLAQQVKEVFEEYGLDAHEYGLFCYDEWPEQEAVIQEWDAEHDTEGNVIREAGSEILEPYQAAGNRYGIRYEELFAFIISAI